MRRGSRAGTETDTHCLSRGSPRGDTGNQEPRIPVTGQEMECLLVQDQALKQKIIFPLRFLLVAGSHCGKVCLGERQRTKVTPAQETGVSDRPVSGEGQDFHCHSLSRPGCLAISFLWVFQQQPVCSLKTSAILKGSLEGGLNITECFVHYPILMKCVL